MAVTVGGIINNKRQRRRARTVVSSRIYDEMRRLFKLTGSVAGDALSWSMLQSRSDGYIVSE